MPASLLPAVARLAARDDRPDADLIARFLARADEGAFAELVRRHGPMVLGVCRRFLGPTPDADDAFQAAFLVLVRRARQVAWRESVGAWLYGVAVRVARKARAVRARRRAAERQVTPMTPAPTAPAAEPDDLAAVLDEELAALPEAYRRPLVLCELQGRTRREAARELGLAEGTLSSRLARGRRLLRARLARRGVGPAAVAGLTAAVPADLAAATVRGAAAVLGGAAGTVPAAVWSLTEGVVKTMVTAKLKLVVLMAAVGLGLTVAGANWGTGSATAAGEPPTQPEGKKGAPVALDLGFPVLGTKAAAGPPPATRPDKDLLYFSVELFGPDTAPLPVATIFGDVPVTREAFADHLIRRYGKKELELFVNKRIIAHAAARKAVVVTADEVKASVEEHMKALGVTPEQFAKNILPQYGKTMAEWMEDVATPQVLLAKLCGDKVKTVTEAELRQAFDRKYGEKRDCRAIVWVKADFATARRVVAAVRADEAAFDKAARAQLSTQLAAAGGRIGLLPRPVPGMAATVNDAAAGLKPGEVSPLIENENDCYVVKCDRIVPPDGARSFETEKAALLPEVLQEKLGREVPKLFDELKREAQPRYHLTFEEPKVRPEPAKK